MKIMWRISGLTQIGIFFFTSAIFSEWFLEGCENRFPNRQNINCRKLERRRSFNYIYHWTSALSYHMPHNSQGDDKERNHEIYVHSLHFDHLCTIPFTTSMFCRRFPLPCPTGMWFLWVFRILLSRLPFLYLVLRRPYAAERGQS